MEKTSEFIVGERQQKSLRQLECEELFADYLQYFSPEGQATVEKLKSKQILTPKETQTFARDRNKWWQEKYEFPYARGTERHKLLERKYDVGEEVSPMMELQEQLLLAIKNNDTKTLEKTKAVYLSKYPDQLEGVTSLLEFSAYLENQKYLEANSFSNKRPLVRAEMLKRVEEATQYSFILTDFVSQNMDNKDFLAKFWAVLNKIGEGKNMLKKTHQLQRGVLSQVATFAIFDRLNLKPRLSHPKEDAFKSVDFWVEGAGAVQVKGSGKRKDELFIETDVVNFPGIETEDESNIKHVNSHLMHQMQKFSRKISAYEKEIKKPIKGYFAIIPYQEFDLVTGEPSEEIIKRTAESLGLSYPLAVSPPPSIPSQSDKLA